MLELILSVAIIALLAGLLLPALSLVKRSSHTTRELAAARQLMVAYRAYAYDHNGVLMPGYNNIATLPAFDEAGNELMRQIAARYPWRLAPYVDYNLKGFYQDERVLEVLLQNKTQKTYVVSLFPALGINSVFLGGDTDYAHYEPVFGRFYLTRLSEAKRPARLIVFASARINGPNSQAVPGSPGVVEGFHRVWPPYIQERKWRDQYRPNCLWPDCKALHFGFVSLRHHFRKAVIGFFDGHTGSLDEAQIQDMRHWADQATSPDWTVKLK